MGEPAEFYDPVSGRLQSSPSLLGMKCRRTGTATTGTRQGGNTTASSLAIDVSGYSVPVIALVGPYLAAMSGVNQSGQRVFATSAPIGTTYTYYVFDWAAALPEHAAIVKFWSLDTSQLVFSSKYWPMKLIGAIDMYEGRGQVTYNAMPGVSLASACMTPGGHSRQNDVNCYDSGGPVVDPDLPSCNDIRGRNDGKLYGGSSDGSTITAGEVSWDDVLVQFGNYSNYQQYEGGWEVPNKIGIIDVTNIPVGRTFF